MVSAYLFKCFRFEQALHVIEPGVALPYWDSVLDSYLPDPSDSVLFTKKYLGSASGPVQNPFANFPVLSNCHSYGSTLQRNGNINQNWLYEQNDIDNVLAHSTFQALSNDPMFELDHSGVHQYFIGHMNDLNCATADPLFYLHHSFVDCIFQEFLNAAVPTVTPSSYPAAARGGFYHQASSQMRPFLGMINSDGLDASRYTRYTYDAKPSSKSCTSHNDCGSKASLWCSSMLTPPKCRARVRRGGNCTGLPHDACQPCKNNQIHQCTNNVCTCI